MAVKFANNAFSTLANSISDSATTVSVQAEAASRFPEPAPGDWFPITVVDAAANMEIMRCTARSGATLTVVRAQEGTIARAFEAGASISIRVSAGALEAFRSELQADVQQAIDAAEEAADSVSEAQDLIFATAEVMEAWRNKIINGDFQIQQRVPGTIPAGETGFALDRIKVINGTNQPVVCTRQRHTPGQTDVPGEPRYKLRLAFAAPPTSGNLIIEQAVEDVGTLAGKTATMRAYMTGPASAGTLGAELLQKFGTGGSPSADVSIDPDELDIAAIRDDGTMKRNAVFSVPALTGKTIGDSDDCIVARWVLAPRQTGNYEISHWSLVAGDSTLEDDPFARRNPAQEIELCRRYYEVGIVGWAGNVTSGTAYLATASYVTGKRKLPEVIIGEALWLVWFPTYEASPGNFNYYDHGFIWRRTANSTAAGGTFANRWAADAEY